jgi:4-amino-4-deoxy-L-arabinose transferase-like glycosyltransferase
MTPPWRAATTATWVLVFVAWSGVWKASRELGVATWWLGPDGAPRPIVVMLLPFVVPLVMVVLALNNVRRLPWYGLAAAAIAAVIGIVDLSYVRRLGIVEIVIAAAGAAVAIAGFAGVYRREPTGAPEPQPVDPAGEAQPEAPVTPTAAVADVTPDRAGPNDDGSR